MSSRDLKPTDSYSEKLMKLLPAEVTAAYLAIRSIVQIIGNGQDATDIAPYILFSMILLLTIITPVFSIVMGFVEQRPLAIFLSASFFIWAINIEYDTLIPIVPNGFGQIAIFIIPISLILWAGLALPMMWNRP